MTRVSTLYVGLISGTSVDAVDCAAVEFAGAAPRLIATHSHPLPPQLRQELLDVAQGGAVALEHLGGLDTAVGRLFAKGAQTLLTNHGIAPEHVAAIGSHGQTIYHHPVGPLPFTLQLGDPSTIAERTGITTVADFRRRDMAAGGQGAPLVPAFHAALFRTTAHTRAVLNIGGIANLSILPADPELPVTGFDTGPGNCLMDTWANRTIGEPFDRDGAWGATGTPDPGLLATLLTDPYFAAQPPKSSGREYFHLAWLERILSGLPPEGEAANLQATLRQLTVTSIAEELQRHAPTVRELLVCGGGAHNGHLLADLQQALPQVRVTTTSEFGIHVDWVEAAAFAWLARQTLRGEPGNLPAVTGAHAPVVLGGIYPGRAGLCFPAGVAS